LVLYDPLTSRLYPNRESVQQYQHQQLQSILTYAWHHSAFYRELYQRYGIQERDLPDVTLQNLPFVSKSTIQEHFDDVVTDPRLRKRDLTQWLQTHPDPRESLYDDIIATVSSGSSSSPGLIVYHRTAWDLINSTLSTRLHRSQHNLSGKIRLASYISTQGNYGGITTVLRLPSDAYDVRSLSILDPAEQVIEELNVFQPQRLTGYTNSIGSLAEWALQGYLHIAPSLITVSGEPLTASTRQTIRAAWDVDLYNIYTAGEARYLAVQGPGQQEMAVLDELYIVEILDDHDRPAAPGEVGRVVATSLVNRTQPILRYELGDQAVCGRQSVHEGSTKIRQIRGRVNDALPVCLARDREDTIHPHALIAGTGEIGLRQVQFVSRRPDRVQIDYVADTDRDTVIRTAFQRILDLKGASGTTFEVRRVPHIAPDPQTGKHRLVRIEGVHATPSRVVLPRPPGGMNTRHLRPTNPFNSFPREAIEQSIVRRFEQQVQRVPAHVAVRTVERSWTYAALNQSANAVAHALLARGDPSHAPIALICDLGVTALLAILGSLKAGSPYIALDPMAPEAHLARLLTDAGARVCLTTASYQSLAESCAPEGCQVLNMDTLGPQLNLANPPIVQSADSLACIMYTSGTTGQPKGIMQNHRDVLHRVMAYTNDLHVSTDDRLTLLHGLSSSASLRHLFSALLNGATLHPFDLHAHDLATFTTWLRQHGITLCHLPASVFRSWASLLQATDTFPHLRALYVANEPVSKRDVDLYKAHFADTCLFVNALVLSEAATVCQYFLNKQTIVTQDGVPVGYAAQDKEVLILDDNGHPVKAPGEGEIAVRSRYLAVGYWRQPELTETMFQPDTSDSEMRLYRTGDLGRVLPDGRIFHLGRKDLQVKIRGYRVELAEVEKALQALPTVQDAVVVAQDIAAGGTQLVAFVVAVEQPGPPAAEFRRALAYVLPKYMIPSQIVNVTALPRTSNGKVDRRAFRVPPAAVQDRSESQNTLLVRTPVERIIVEVWQEVLRVECVGVYDNFFDLGGDSLQCADVIATLERRLGVQLTPRDLIFQALQQLAAVCEERKTFGRPASAEPLTQKLWRSIKNALSGRRHVYR
jgi:amino acid adenylation domain-containing protein